MEQQDELGSTREDIEPAAEVIKEANHSDSLFKIVRVCIVVVQNCTRKNRFEFSLFFFHGLLFVGRNKHGRLYSRNSERGKE